ncbi:MAG: class I SAM-dependent methyltransferase [Symploca sp. SIO2E6]|nr:class I SAM-dependent methyltransferase [Symploca sp. SIO2E6]
MKTDYIGHDKTYQRYRQEANRPGWMAATDLAKVIQQLERILLFDYFPKQGKLIELGCGAGNISIYLAQKGYEVSGVDIAPTAIDWAIENANQAQVQVDFLVGDVLHLEEIADESFDIVMDGFCFHCIIGDDRGKFLQTAHRLLKLDGRLCIRTMCNQVPDTQYYREHFDPQTRCTMHGDLATRYIGLSNDLIMEVIQAGFKVLQLEISPPLAQDGVEGLLLVAAKDKN